MEFRHLRCFLVLAKELHFGRAAQRLAMSQPPLSVAIQQLEEAVGTRLFERDSKRVKLTAAGEAFRVQAQALVTRAEEAKVHAREVAAGALGRVRIGFVGSMLFRGLPSWLHRFQAEHARIEIELRELNSQEQIEALMHDQLDVGFLQTDKLPAALQSIPVGSEPFVCCLPEGHPAARKRQVPLALLSEDPFVLFSRQVSPDSYASIIDMCRAAGFYPRVRHEVRHWLSVLAVVSQGMGVSVVPAPLRTTGMAGAVFRPLAGGGRQSDVFCAWMPEMDQPARDRFLKVVSAGVRTR
ncbi:LysR substrate-binding domain-containing protein [Ramlibacter solisilvae]|uniref:LysR family transcriptional regulator n=1 Tax=Ramlibacter tataouinensis TaxID=94132 RepID=A0A127JYC1_9BURK|nr:LysR family transcriptional regulator [Ramlibacter tataouinensis]AMO24843.1 LysR family transcriptional regulator [Ramlibacter tataouinensis]